MGHGYGYGHNHRNSYGDYGCRNNVYWLYSSYEELAATVMANLSLGIAWAKKAAMWLLLLCVFAMFI